MRSGRERALHGVLVVDKPIGPTSHDVVDRVRRVLGMRRVGHTGTLDPFASGVLPLCLGNATRLARFMTAADKTYRASVRFGFATTTDDHTGEPLGPTQHVDLSWEQVRQAAQALTGALEQVPPAYSAKRVGGQRLYASARRGESVERRPCAVYVHSFDVLTLAGDTATIEVTCSTGTYIRALARDLGAALGLGGHLTALRRTRSGSFGETQALGWAIIENSAAVPTAAEQVEAHILGLDRLLPELPVVCVNPEGRKAVGHGQTLVSRHLVGTLPEPDVARVRVLDAVTGALLALAVPNQRGPASAPTTGLVELQPDVVLVESTQRFTGA